MLCRDGSWDTSAYTSGIGRERVGRWVGVRVIGPHLILAGFKGNRSVEVGINGRTDSLENDHEFSIGLHPAFRTHRSLDAGIGARYCTSGLIENSMSRDNFYQS